uniref:Uncharacterized protein n=1 Tax=Anthoceros angustus TaxID=48387 RepID=A0A2P1L4X4_ANTAG|nr:hypothetical protein AnanMp40 [Anthoceros angustus]AVP12864.1 hypothetical protein AnanMp40 [Anthoceros angustus]
MEKPKSPNMGKVILQRHSTEFPSPDPDFAELSAQAEVLILLIRRPASMYQPQRNRTTKKSTMGYAWKEELRPRLRILRQIRLTYGHKPCMRAPASPWLGP